MSRFLVQESRTQLVDDKGFITPRWQTNLGTAVVLEAQKRNIIAKPNAVLPVYANNAAAKAGGLIAGDFYRTGGDPDPVCVVH